MKCKECSILENMIARAKAKGSIPNQIRVILYQNPNGIEVSDIASILNKSEMVVWARLYELRRKKEADHEGSLWWFI